MAFDVNTITVQGAIAIASATAGNKLVIDGCDAVTSIYTQAQAVQIASRPATPASTTTSIALAGSTENHVYAYASFIQSETGQPGGDVHSFLLYGHSENTPNVVVVVAVASSTDPVHLPEPGDVTNRTEVQFELSFSATDEVVTVAGTSMYTTRGEFLLLKNRTVTTHAEGETTVGDSQLIYGNKTFKSPTAFNAEAVFSSGASIINGLQIQSGGASIKGNVYADRLLGLTGDYSSSTIRCVTDENAYTDKFYFHLESDSYPDIYADLGIIYNEDTSNIKLFAEIDDGGDTPETYGVDLDATTGKLSVHADMEVSGGGDLYVTGNLSVSPDSYAQIGNLAAFPDTNVIWLFNSILPDPSNLNLGSIPHRFSKLYCDEIYGAASNQVVGYTGMLRLFGTDSDDHYVDVQLRSKTATGDIYPSLQVDLNNDTQGETCHLSFRDGTLLMYGTGGSAIGTSDDAIGIIYTNQLAASTSQDILMRCSLLQASGTVFNVGANGDRINGVYTSALDTPSLTVSVSGISVKSTVDCNDSTAWLGTSQKPFAGVYAGDLRGCIPSPTSNTSTPPIGSIFLGFITAASQLTVNSGATIDFSSVSNQITAIYYAKFDVQGSAQVFVRDSSGGTFNTGKYRTLSSGLMHSVGSEWACMCLVMCIG